MRKLSLILLMLLVLVGCGEESEEITEAKMDPVDEFVGKWYAKGINGKSIDDYFKELAIVGFEEELDEELRTLIDIETNWAQCCSVDADMWIDFKSNGTYERDLKIETVMDITKILDDIGDEESRALIDPEDEVDDIDEETKSETGTYFITEASYKLIPNTSAEDRLYQVEIEEGNWRIDGNSLTLTYLDEDGSSFSLIYTKSN